MKKEEKHEEVLNKLYQQYWDEGIDKNLEFIWDGPSHWEKYENSIPRIVFLVKESHDSFHPSTPRKVENRFTKNIARWASVIISNIDSNSNIKDLFCDNLQDAYDSIGIVETKKIDDGRTSSPDSNIKKFAWLGREFLKQQLEILEPHIIVCCGTIESFDIIYNYSEEEKEIKEKEINTSGNRRCWNSNNVIVLDFYHPSCRNKTDIEMFDLLKEFISDKLVQAEYFQLINNKYK